MSASHEALPAAATVIASPERRAVALRDALVDRGLVEAGEAEALAHRAPEVLSPANGARVVARTWVDRDFRKLTELGLQLPAATNIWDTSGETRYVVLPMRPQGTEHLTEEQLASLVTRAALIGVARIEDQATG